MQYVVIYSNIFNNFCKKNMYKLIPSKLAVTCDYICVCVFVCVCLYTYDDVLKMCQVLHNRTIAHFFCVSYFTFNNMINISYGFSILMLNCRHKEHRMFYWILFQRPKWPLNSKTPHAQWLHPLSVKTENPVTQAGYAPCECRGLGLRAAAGLISFGGHSK